MKRDKLENSPEVQGIPVLQDAETYKYLISLKMTLSYTTTQRKLPRKNSSKELETFGRQRDQCKKYNQSNTHLRYTRAMMWFRDS